MRFSNALWAQSEWCHLVMVGPMKFKGGPTFGDGLDGCSYAGGILLLQMKIFSGNIIGLYVSFVWIFDCYRHSGGPLR